MPFPEGIGHVLRELPGDDTKVRVKLRASGCMRENVNVIAFNGDHLDFHAKLSRVMAIEPVKCGKRGGMTKAARQCTPVDFENDMNRIPRREWARATAVTRAAQSSPVTPAAVLENELLTSHVTDTSWVEVGMQAGALERIGF